jgi:hypothetical protein
MPRRAIKRITIGLPSDLKALAKRKAAAEKRSLNSLIEDGLRVVLGAPKDVDGRDTGERSDAVLRPAMPGHDER